MSTFVLIHGAWHGAWCWSKVAPLLEAKGHEVKALDLPGHGEDPTPVSEVTLADYTDRVCGALDESPDPVVLVGHSMGGAVISEAAERRPEKIDVLVYLAAFLLPNGTSVRDVAQEDTKSMLGPSIKPDEDEGGLTVKEDKRKHIFYQDCSDDDVERARLLFRSDSPVPGGTPVKVTDGNFGSVKRAYIECLHDHAVSPSIQKKMYNDLPCARVLSMNTGHCPFLSALEELAEHLESLTAGN
jgi:pimeloyl-ACP methyl ester carboxylesterase